MRISSSVFPIFVFQGGLEQCIDWKKKKVTCSFAHNRGAPIDRPISLTISTSPVHLRNVRVGSALSIVYLGLFLRGQSDRGVYPTSAEDKNYRSYTSTASYAVMASTGALPAMIPVMCRGFAICRNKWLDRIVSQLELVLLQRYRLIIYIYVAMVTYAILLLHSKGYCVTKLFVHSSSCVGHYFKFYF